MVFVEGVNMVTKHERPRPQDAAGRNYTSGSTYSQFKSMLICKDAASQPK